MGESNTLSGGARVAMTVSGLGKLSPNSVMVGFKQDWKEDPVGLASYLQIMFSAFELELSFAILRLDSKVVTAIQQFKEKRRRTGTVDVWWLFDDGGLTLLIPHIVMTRKRFRDCSLRVFALGLQANQLEEETRKLTNMLDRFRINATQVTVIPK